MGYVKFKGSSDVYQVKLKNIGDNLVRLYPPLPNVELTTGFELLTRPKDGKVYGNYLAYTSLYRKTEEGAVILSNDGSVWKEPVYTVSFEGENCTIIGKTSQKVKAYDELEIPVAIPNENYEFLEWTPKIPLHGKITKNEKYIAKTVYVKTWKKNKQKKFLK